MMDEAQLFAALAANKALHGTSPTFTQNVCRLWLSMDCFFHDEYVIHISLTVDLCTRVASPPSPFVITTQISASISLSNQDFSPALSFLMAIMKR